MLTNKINKIELELKEILEKDKGLELEDNVPLGSVEEYKIEMNERNSYDTDFMFIYMM